MNRTQPRSGHGSSDCADAACHSEIIAPSAACGRDRGAPGHAQAHATELRHDRRRVMAVHGCMGSRYDVRYLVREVERQAMPAPERAGAAAVPATRPRTGDDRRRHDRDSRGARSRFDYACCHTHPRVPHSRHACCASPHEERRIYVSGLLAGWRFERKDQNNQLIRPMWQDERPLEDLSYFSRHN